MTHASWLADAPGSTLGVTKDSPGMPRYELFIVALPVRNLGVGAGSPWCGIVKA